MFAEYIEWRANHPSDDLITELLNAEVEEPDGRRRPLERTEVLAYAAMIAGAGAICRPRRRAVRADRHRRVVHAVVERVGQS